MIIDDADAIYYGTAAISKVYLGTTQVYPVSFNYVISKNVTTTNSLQVGAAVTKDMDLSSKTSNAAYIPGDSSLTSIRSYWQDWGGDIFDGWGFFYIYDVGNSQFLSPQLSPINQADGVISTQTFTINGRTFTIKHGYPVQGIFKMDISVNDNLPFIFGTDGNMGSNGSTANSNYTHAYTLRSQAMTLHYNYNVQLTTTTEALYSYFVPYEVSKNQATIPYVSYRYSGDNLAIHSVEVQKGITAYFAKQYDVKNWVVNDLKLDNLY